MIKVLSVIGSTASGKSDLAIALAQKFDGEIVSCDSVQIYKYFNIGSAKPSLKQLNIVPHHLIDILEPDIICNAGYWKDKAIEIIDNIVSRNKIPIIVGGTGLYLKALYCGMFEENSRDQEYRNLLQQRSQQEGLSILYQELLQQDPIYANKISNTDALRIIRALEAIYVTRSKFSDLHKYNVKPNWQWIFTQPVLSREEIYDRITTRINTMFTHGLVEETQELLKRFGKNISAINTIGYRHVLEYLEQKTDFNTMKQTLIRDTKRFSKRQRTLFRSLISEIDLIHPDILLSQGDF